ncbi:L-talarate/galactarate dehydratase [Prauserella cavernicola]|uniref:Mandelate racemase/muconate lactonizing enzyme family protein n=1 Tax=Prauserella cavernicola TaxID=2800127 RepID=A0A934V7L3_9PSEU|nr:mandelate racemase/muconate lactonizing enzyme family protein [Prauserella cavernicola]MBK1787360.1 mandelate racemase/muconate lactonizing enzyme family protein [Prauserella cavernicola]
MTQSDATTQDRPSASRDQIDHIALSSIAVPLTAPLSDAKVYTGRQRPLTEVVLLVAEIRTAAGQRGTGFSYALRTGGPAQFAHAVELAPALIGDDPADVTRIWDKLAWLTASTGSSGLGVQAIAALDTALWDLKARTAGLPLAKLLGSHRDAVPCYNTSGGYLNVPIAQLLDSAERSLAAGIGGIKLKVGHPDRRVDLERVAAVREKFGAELPLMVDANQQWDLPQAHRMFRDLEEFDLTWIEEPLAASDTEGHAALATAHRTPVATGEMLSSAAELHDLLEHGAVGFLQPDAPRIGGVTPFLDTMVRTRHARRGLAPHFVMELHLPLAAAFSGPVWVEHIEWLQPLFGDSVRIANGHMRVPDAQGLGLELDADARSRWTRASTEVTAPA